MIDNKYYNEEKREIKTIEENEYIIDDLDESKMNLFKRLRLGINDNKEHYSIIVVDDIDKYMEQFIDNEE